MNLILSCYCTSMCHYAMPLPPIDPMPVVIELRATPANPLLTRPVSHRLGRREMKRRRTQTNPDYG